MLLQTWVCNHHFKSLHLTLWDIHQRVELLVHTVIPFFIFLRNCHTAFPQQCTILHSHHKSSNFFRFSPKLTTFFFLSNHPEGCELVFHCEFEKEMATHSSILAWRIPWTEEPGGLQSMGSQRVGHD